MEESQNLFQMVQFRCQKSHQYCFKQLEAMVLIFTVTFAIRGKKVEKEIDEEGQRYYLFISKITKFLIVVYQDRYEKLEVNYNLSCDSRHW